VSSSARNTTTDSSKRLTQRAGLAKLHADRIVLRPREARAEPEHQPTACQSIDRRRGASQQRRVMELVVDHERPDAEAGGHFRCHHQGDERVDCADVVVGVQLVVPKTFDLPRRSNQAGVIVQSANLHGETERLHVSPSASRTMCALVGPHPPYRTRLAVNARGSFRPWR
jgi:hypothetical protein